MRCLTGIILLFLSIHTHAQPITFDKTLKAGITMQNAVSQVTADGGYILFTSFLDSATASRSFYLVKIDSFGIPKWKRLYGVCSGYGCDGLTPAAITETADGSYVGIGSYFEWQGSSNANEKEWLYIFKADSSGNIAWAQRTNTNTFDYYYACSITDAGNDLFIGIYPGFPSYVVPPAIIKLNSQTGNTIWIKKLTGSPPYTAAYYPVVRKTTGDSLTILLSPRYSFFPNPVFYVIKTDSMLNADWAKSYGSTNTTVPFDFQPTQDSGFIVTGATVTVNADTVAFLSKIDRAGNVMWFKSFKDTFIRVGRAVEQTKDHGFIMAGGPGGFSVFSVKDGCFLLKTDSAGNFQWAKKFPNKGEATSVQQTPDKGYFFSGRYNTKPNRTATYCVKADSAGAACLSYPANSLTMTSGTLSQLAVANPFVSLSSVSLQPFSFMNISSGGYMGGNCPNCTTSIPAIITPSGPTIFCVGGSVTLTASPATEYLWSTNSLSQSINVATSGTFTVTISDSNGCTNTSVPVQVMTHFYPSVPVITQIMDTLFSTPASFYQWYLNGNPINGATSQKYVPTQHGIYTVTVSDSIGCASSSYLFSFFLSAINSNNHSAEFDIYPNPTTGVININSISQGNLRISTMQGSVVCVYKIKPGHTIVHLPERLSPGIYILYFISPGMTSRAKMISLSNKP